MKAITRAFGLAAALTLLAMPAQALEKLRVGKAVPEAFSFAPLEIGFNPEFLIAGLESARVWVGDRLRVGEVLLEVTAPRIPCHILARRMEDAQFVTKFRAASSCSRASLRSPCSCSPSSIARWRHGRANGRG